MTDIDYREPTMITEPLNVCHVEGEVVMHGMARIEGCLTPEAALGTAHRLLAVVTELGRLNRR